MARRPSRGYLVPHILRTLLRRRETVAYPAGPLLLHESYRGRVTVDIDRCVGCGLCARDCPTSAIEVDRQGTGAVRVKIYHDRCATCGLCGSSCPRGAIHQVPSFAASAPSRAELYSEWTREGDQKVRA